MRERAAAMVTFLEAEVEKWKMILQDAPDDEDAWEGPPARWLVIEIRRNGGEMSEAQLKQFLELRGKKGNSPGNTITHSRDAGRIAYKDGVGSGPNPLYVAGPKADDPYQK